MSIHSLITRFHDDLPRIRSAAYNETEVRVQFINPLFEALGWDMRDTAGRHEIQHEDRVRISGKAKAPDYGFYLDGRRRFFVEAKKPAVNLDRHADPAYQLRRYAWTAKLPLSVLTDFEEFAVYERRLRARGTEDEERIQRRLAKARVEEGRIGEFNHVIVNDDLDRAVAQLEAIIRSHFKGNADAR